MKLCESYQARFMFDIDFINEKIICVIRYDINKHYLCVHDIVLVIT